MVSEKVTQTHLEIDAEDFTVKQKLIIRRLGEYRTIDRDIRQQERIISGELTRCLPSMAPAGLPEDDRAVMAALRTQRMSDSMQYRVEVVRNELGTAPRYAHRQLIASRLQHIQLDDEKADQAIQDAYMVLTERTTEEYLKLTPAERYASDREREVAEAEDERDRLARLTLIIGPALEDMHEYHLEWWTILWYKYVIGLTEREVYYKAARGGTPLTQDEYRTSREKALHQFDKWAIGLV